jgi:hypothetical protein
MNINVFK